MMAWMSTLRLKALHLQSLVSAMTVTLTGWDSGFGVDLGDYGAQNPPRSPNPPHYSRGRPGRPARLKAAAVESPRQSVQNAGVSDEGRDLWGARHRQDNPGRGAVRAPAWPRGRGRAVLP